MSEATAAASSDALQSKLAWGIWHFRVDGFAHNDPTVCRVPTFSSSGL